MFRVTQYFDRVHKYKLQYNILIYAPTRSQRFRIQNYYQTYQPFHENILRISPIVFHLEL